MSFRAWSFLWFYNDLFDIFCCSSIDDALIQFCARSPSPFGPFAGNCYQCGQPGHRKSGCPQLGKGFKGQCHVCQHSGHSARNCPFAGKNKGGVRSLDDSSQQAASDAGSSVSAATNPANMQASYFGQDSESVGCLGVIGYVGREREMRTARQI